jgi:hypothetical protein
VRMFSLELLAKIKTILRFVRALTRAGDLIVAEIEDGTPATQPLEDEV